MMSSVSEIGYVSHRQDVHSNNNVSKLLVSILSRLDIIELKVDQQTAQMNNLAQYVKQLTSCNQTPLGSPPNLSGQIPLSKSSTVKNYQPNYFEKGQNINIPFPTDSISAPLQPPSCGQSRIENGQLNSRGGVPQNPESTSTPSSRMNGMVHKLNAAAAAKILPSLAALNQIGSSFCSSVKQDLLGRPAQLENEGRSSIILTNDKRKLNSYEDLSCHQNDYCDEVNAYRRRSSVQNQLSKDGTSSYSYRVPQSPQESKIYDNSTPNSEKKDRNLEDKIPFHYSSISNSNYRIPEYDSAGIDHVEDHNSIRIKNEFSNSSRHVEDKNDEDNKNEVVQEESRILVLSKITDHKENHKKIKKDNEIKKLVLSSRESIPLDEDIILSPQINCLPKDEESFSESQKETNLSEMKTNHLVKNEDDVKVNDDNKISFINSKKISNISSRELIEYISPEVDKDSKLSNSQEWVSGSKISSLDENDLLISVDGDDKIKKNNQTKENLEMKTENNFHFDNNNNNLINTISDNKNDMDGTNRSSDDVIAPISKVFANPFIMKTENKTSKEDVVNNLMAKKNSLLKSVKDTSLVFGVSPSDSETDSKLLSVFSQKHPNFDRNRFSLKEENTLSNHSDGLFSSTDFQL